MNRVARMLVQDKLNRSSDRTDGTRQDGRSYEDGYRDGYDSAKYEIKGEYDREDGAHRRSKTTGRYMRDRGESTRLTNHDLLHWEKNLRNADGTRGKHFDMQHVEEAANKLGIRFDDFSEKELCMTMNMLYSDFCEALRPVVSQFSTLLLENMTDSMNMESRVS